jgi:hypothetical protein
LEIVILQKGEEAMLTPTLPDEIIDMLLDQEGFECDPLTRVEGDTPLHSAIRYINSLPMTPETSEFSSQLISMMTEAGNDPRIKNKAKLTPCQLTDPRNVKLKRQLEDAVDIMQNQGDFIVADGEGVDGEEEEFDDDYAGSASDSDFDADEFKRERERRKKEKAAKQESVSAEKGVGA